MNRKFNEMKKLISLFSIVFLSLWVFGQWVSPGSGTLYTLSSLPSVAPGAVSSPESGVYQISQNLTLSAGDTLLLESSAARVSVGDNITITILGTLASEARSGRLLFTGDSSGTSPFELRLDNAATARISQVHFQHGYQLFLYNAGGVEITGCEFSGFRNSAINLMNSSPIIQNCYFHHNQKAAISSAVNTNCSPKILDNVFYNNDLSNANVPQINLGPGAADTILIVGNRIEGVAQTMSGGIGVMSLGGGSTRLTVSGNHILHNRYGYTQNGSNIFAIITDNIIEHNDLETTPNNGGSGISIYGSGTSCGAKIRRNLIHDNLWGVTAIYYHSIDMGTAEDPGGNVLYHNGNSNVEYELYNNSGCDMNAVGNYWGDNTLSHAEDVIYHQNDNSSYGLVTFSPILKLEPEFLSFRILQENNPELFQDLLFDVAEGSDTIFAVLHSDGVHNLPEMLAPTIELPSGVACEPGPSEPQDFSSPVTYTLTTPHGTSRTYVAAIVTAGGVEYFEEMSVSLFPNPVTGDCFTLRNGQGGTVKVEIRSLTGQLVRTAQRAGVLLSVSTAGLEKGVYLVTIIKENQRKTVRVVNL